MIARAEATFGGRGVIARVPDVDSLHVFDQVLEAGAVISTTADALPRVLGEGYHGHGVRPRARRIQALRELLSFNLQ